MNIVNENLLIDHEEVLHQSVPAVDFRREADVMCMCRASVWSEVVFG